MFQFSKTIEPKSRRTAKTAEKYFANWISWFQSRGIKTEIRRDGRGAHLWREGIEATNRNKWKKVVDTKPKKEYQ